MNLRPYQSKMEADIYAEWNRGARDVLGVAATGSGKTVLFSKILSDNQGACVAIAHRQELVSQISLALARNRVRHRIIGADALRRAIVGIHIAEVGYSFYDPNARCMAAGVDTLVRMDPNEPIFSQTTLVVQDEAHHLLRDNKWGKARNMFPNARGLGVSATPSRADGRGLGWHADGVFDAMVLAPNMRDLINMGYLTDYRIFAPPSDLDLSQVTISEGGDFSPPKLRAAVHKSHIVGDVVAHYQRIAPGKLGVTFAVDVESATEIAKAYRAAGVPAEVVSSKTPDALRAAILRRFRNREILQLVNVDLFGEGFDLPAIEVVSMARPTQSFALYAQQFGRALRLMDGKLYAIIIDHVGNVMRHGLPDAPRIWTLNRRERRSRGTPNDVTPVRTCMNPECMAVFERVYRTCPYCGHYSEPSGRSLPEMVDGELGELDAAVLARMRGEVDAAKSLAFNVPHGAGPEIVGALKRKHWEKQQAQAVLYDSMALFGGWQTQLGRDVAESQRRFYHAFGVDVATAQTLNRADAEELNARINKKLVDENVTKA